MFFKVGKAEIGNVMTTRSQSLRNFKARIQMAHLRIGSEYYVCHEEFFSAIKKQVVLSKISQEVSTKSGSVGLTAVYLLFNLKIPLGCLTVSPLQIPEASISNAMLYPGMFLRLNSVPFLCANSSSD